jgi:hypothetical protein
LLQTAKRSEHENVVVLREFQDERPACNLVCEGRWFFEASLVYLYVN